MVVAGGVYGWKIVYVLSNCPRIDSPVIPTILCVGYSYSYLADNCSMCFGYWFKFLLKLYPLYTCIFGLIC